jgi:hypothetical protein
MKPYYYRAIELLEEDKLSQRQIAKKIKKEFKIDENVDSIRRNITNWSKDTNQEHDALQQACEEFGIPVNQVGHYWYKGKHISIHAKTESQKTYEDLRDEIIKEMEQHVPEYPKIYYTPQENPHLLVIDPADVHIGKLCSAFETGEDYDCEIAVNRVREGVEGILRKASGFKVDQILFVAGNDILHVDSPKRTTTSGTPQDTDGMWYDNFLKAKRLYVDIIQRLLHFAPVHFVYNPSNHDYMNGFFLADVIQTWYKTCSSVTFDCSIAHRKYYKYGNNLIGTTHGDGAKNNDLPLLMAQESAVDWSNTKHRYVYTHHVHHKNAKDHIGVTVESLRSPSGTDGWHHRNGYQHNPKAIEGFLHCKDNGQVARLTHLF